MDIDSKEMIVILAMISLWYQVFQERQSTYNTKPMIYDSQANQNTYSIIALDPRGRSHKHRRYSNSK